VERETLMVIETAHSWKVLPRKARQIQLDLARRVVIKNRFFAVRRVAGVDLSVKEGVGRSAIVVLRWPDLEVLEVALAERPVEFSYVPGLFSFHEAPPIIEACQQLKIDPVLFFFDGQGYAYPRWIGLVSHMEILLKRSSNGCAKTRYIVRYDQPHAQAGHYTDLRDKDELIGGAADTDRCQADFCLSRPNKRHCHPLRFCI
jgi:deoxyribonuclease V